MSDEPARQFGPYQVIAPIGEGGMGQVFKARDSRLDRIVALKISHAQFSDRFAREARATAALNHPHIATLYDVGPDYLVMEFVEGETLRGPLPLARALLYAGQILEALEAAHRKGIVHRDLKPANVMVSKSGIKLLDFGLAQVKPLATAGDRTATMALTTEGTIAGTLQYMSPEQLQGKDADRGSAGWRAHRSRRHAAAIREDARAVDVPAPDLFRAGVRARSLAGWKTGGLPLDRREESGTGSVSATGEWRQPAAAEGCAGRGQ